VEDVLDLDDAVTSGPEAAVPEEAEPEDARPAPPVIQPRRGVLRRRPDAGSEAPGTDS
jgi:hypothetical protein